MTPGIVVGRVLLPCDHVLRVEEMFVSSDFDLRKFIRLLKYGRQYLVDDAGLQVHEESPGDVFAGAGGGEEG